VNKLRDQDIKTIYDARGVLTVVNDTAIPFNTRRMFTVSNVPPAMVRGHHAHYECRQFLICANGLIQVDTDNGKEKQTIILKAGQGLELPPMVWASQKFTTAHSVLLVFCSHYFKDEDYICDYDEFLKLVNNKTK
jgi:hypothetical protein